MGWALDAGEEELALFPELVLLGRPPAGRLLGDVVAAGDVGITSRTRQTHRTTGPCRRADLARRRSPRQSTGTVRQPPLAVRSRRGPAAELAGSRPLRRSERQIA